MEIRGQYPAEVFPGGEMVAPLTDTWPCEVWVRWAITVAVGDKEDATVTADHGCKPEPTETAVAAWHECAG